MKRHFGFSLLELLIALVLLGVLSALAWSILDNFRSAEQRGWKVATRLQAIRSARLWLEEDLMHVSDTFPANGFDATSRAAVNFQGTSSGFSITYSPSIDPLPWLEELVMQTQDSIPNQATSLNRYTRLGLYTVEAKYQLQSDGSLLRTITSQAPRAPSTTSSLASDTETTEPVLTVNDLYRQSDQVDLMNVADANVQQSKLGPIYRPRFRYHDGLTWKSGWTANSSAALPAAIELSFDLDNLYTTQADETDDLTASDNPADNLPDPLADVDVPVVELDDDVSEAMLQEPRQVRIVVRLPWSAMITSGKSARSGSANEEESFSNGSSSAFLEESSE
jgi:prepilin-type N-terminal cleavage/methylation domain-containing protein